MANITPGCTPWRLADSLKNSAVEEWVDHHIHRPVAFLIIRPLQFHFTFITPLHLTGVAMLLGVAAGVGFACVRDYGPIGYVYGAMLLFSSVVFDCADGMLARLRGTSSRLGELADGYSDLVAGAAIWWGMSYAISAGLSQWWVWPINGVSLASIMVHLALYDRFRNYYQNRSKNDAKLPLDVRPAKRSWIYKLFSGFHEYGYGMFFNLVGGRSKAADELAPDTFAAHFYQPMKAISWIGLGTHLCLIYVLALIASINSAHIFLLVHVSLIGAMNGAALYGLWSWKKAEARLARSN